MVNPHQFANLILEPALKACGMYSLDAMYLMLCTAMLESKLTHLKQLPDGPALGFFQIEGATYVDTVRYLSTRPNLRQKILDYCHYDSPPLNPEVLIHNLAYNTLIARTKYYMIHEPIPSYKDVESQANYYKRYYNTSEGSATVESFIKMATDIQGWITHGSETH